VDSGFARFGVVGSLVALGLSEVAATGVMGYLDVEWGRAGADKVRTNKAAFRP
jgi:hypothetical protein